MTPEERITMLRQLIPRLSHGPHRANVAWAATVCDAARRLAVASRSSRDAAAAWTALHNTLGPPGPPLA